MTDAIKITVHVFDKNNVHIHKLELDPMTYEEAEEWDFFNQATIQESTMITLCNKYGVGITEKVGKIVPTYKNVTIGGNKNAT